VARFDDYPGVMHAGRACLLALLLGWGTMERLPPDAYVIDAIADGIARLERADGTLWELPAVRLPAGAREGDVLRASTTDEGRASFVVDADLTAARRAAARCAAEGLQRGPDGDIEL
jgi:hypothetical protein